jgi:hypothetical protein
VDEEDDNEVLFYSTSFKHKPSNPNKNQVKLKTKEKASCLRHET